MNQQDLLLADRTHEALVAHSTFSGTRSGGFYYRDSGMVAIARPSFVSEGTSTAFRLDPAYDAREFLTKAEALYGLHDARFEILCRNELDSDIDEVAKELGFDGPWKDLPRLIIEERVLAEGTEDVRPAETPSERALWRNIIGETFYPELTIGAMEVDFSEDLVASSHDLHPLLQWEGHTAVAAGMMFRCDDVAYICSVGTLEQHRRRGHASAVIRRATNLGFETGADVVFLFGVPPADATYQKLGFRVNSYIHHWTK